jgi:preprotein translocase subunit SecA
MNEQRKVIYMRRDQILDGLDLHAAAMEYLSDAVDSLIAAYCVSEADDEWDLDGLTRELATYWPTTVAISLLEQASSTDNIYDIVMADAAVFYKQREEQLGETVMREIERQVMLRIIDQRWREHLEEMDYLQEGINLRAMGQKDPLTEWQREGYDMFGSLMKGIAQDFVKYVMHVEVVSDDAAGTTVQNIRQTSSDDDTASGFDVAVASAIADGELPPEAAPVRAVSNTPVVKSEFDKTPRNAPCPCGSGKKFKVCHGKTA